MKGRRLAASTGIAVIAGALVLAASPAQAVVHNQPIVLTIDNIVPGIEQEASVAIDVPVQAEIVIAEWSGFDGLGSWAQSTAELCGVVCTPIDELAGARLPAGAYRLQVTVLVPADARPAELSGVATGRLAFGEVASSSALAETGVAPWTAALAAALLLGAGAFALLGRRRDAS